jgi:pimeloyl-ACP methyl ester carboxylesterase
LKLGIPGVKDSLLEEFGIRLLTYDLPGFGESDPHPKRNLESSAIDMSFLADALGVDKFWVIGYSSGSKHAWAALRYIPDRLAGINVIFVLYYFTYNFYLDEIWSFYSHSLVQSPFD